MQLILCLAALAAPICCSAQKPAGAEFVAQPIDGDPVTGRLVALENSWQVTLLNSKRYELKGADLVSVRRTGQSPEVGVSGSQVLLANGDRIRATPQRANQELLDVHSEILGDLQIPLERVQAVVLRPPDSLTARERFLAALMHRAEKHDTVMLANGDELNGEWIGLTDTTVQLRPAGDRTVEVNRGSVRAIALSSELISFPKPKGLFAQLFLADGSEIAMLDGRLDAGRFRGQTAFQREIIVPQEQLLAIDFRNGRLTYLSDLEPDRFRHTPYLATRFDYQRDRSVTGNALSLRGQIYRKGLGVHSHTEMSYRLDKHYRRFEATVGVDDETGGAGSVIFRLLLDDKLAWESPLLTGQSPPHRVQLELGDAKKLSLIVDFGTVGDVQDHADWADARLVQ